MFMGWRTKRSGTGKLGGGGGAVRRRQAGATEGKGVVDRVPRLERRRIKAKARSQRDAEDERDMMVFCYDDDGANWSAAESEPKCPATNLTSRFLDTPCLPYRRSLSAAFPPPAHDHASIFMRALQPWSRIYASLQIRLHLWGVDATPSFRLRASRLDRVLCMQDCECCM